MNRRKFFKITAPIAATPLLLNGVPLKAFDTSHLLEGINCEKIEERVIVLVQLNGGNDGLNTLIPTEQYDIYANLRPTIRIPQNQIQSIDSALSIADDLACTQH